MNYYSTFRLELTIRKSIPDISNSKYVEYNAFKNSRPYYNLSESSALYSVFLELLISGTDLIMTNFSR